MDSPSGIQEQSGRGSKSKSTIEVNKAAVVDLMGVWEGPKSGSCGRDEYNNQAAKSFDKHACISLGNAGKPLVDLSAFRNSVRQYPHRSKCRQQD